MKRLREEGARHVDEGALFRTIEAMRRIVDEATDATKSARRQRERRLRLVPDGRNEADAQAQTEAAAAAEEANQSTLQPWERMFPVEEWT